MASGVKAAIVATLASLPSCLQAPAASCVRALWRGFSRA